MRTLRKHTKQQTNTQYTKRQNKIHKNKHTNDTQTKTTHPKKQGHKHKQHNTTTIQTQANQQNTKHVDRDITKRKKARTTTTHNHNTIYNIHRYEHQYICATPYRNACETTSNINNKTHQT